METIADFSIWIKQLSLEVKKQTVVVRELAVNFTDGEQRQVRHDQVAFLRGLKTRIMREVEDIRRTELAAQSRANKRALFGGGIAFSLGSLFAAAKGRQDAYNIGARMAGSVLSRKVPFGTVLITIDGQGIPKGVKVVSISRLARESNVSESEVETGLKHDGYLLMTPEQFAEFLDKVESGILDGSYSLPVGIDEFTKQIPEGC